MHCLVLRDADTGDLVASYTGRLIPQGLAQLEAADTIIGHNVIDFDVPALQKVYPSFAPDPQRIVDTLIMVQVLWPEVKQGDMNRFRKGAMPGQQVGRQGLAAWGYRLGEHKGEYTEWCAQQGIKDHWALWCPEMQSYCEQDTQVNYILWRRIVGKHLDPRCIRLEHDTALLCQKITRNGFPFDIKAAEALYVEVQTKRDAAAAKLQAAFPPQDAVTVFIPKVNNSARGYVKGRPIERVRSVPFDPASNASVAKRLIERHGWAPTQFTEPTKAHPQGQIQVTETVLEGLPYPEIPDLLDYLFYAKLCAFLVGAKMGKGWLKLVGSDGKMHGRYNTAKALGGRATHDTPNIAQVPKVKSGKKGVLKGREGDYGFECRSLFTSGPFPIMVGSDQSGLELRCLAHFMARYDQGRYIDLVTTGDVHTANQEAAGLPTRDNAKTFIYGYLYGAGAWKVGHIVAPLATDAEKEKRGRALMAQFLTRTTGLKDLRGALTDAVAKQGMIWGLDRRPLTIRKAHAVVNLLLQSAGALICKRWITEIERKLLALGLRHGWDGDFAMVAWVHDEIQIACKSPAVAATVETVCKQEAAFAGEYFGFRCPTAGEAKQGRTWAETH